MSSKFIARLAQPVTMNARTLAILELAIKSHARRLDITVDDSAVASVIEKLRGDGMSWEDGPWAKIIPQLAKQGLIELDSEDGRFSISPLPDLFGDATSSLDEDQRLTLCRFTAIQPVDGAIWVTNPLSDRSLILYDPVDAACVMHFSRPQKMADFAAADHQLIAALLAGDMLVAVDANGETINDREPIRQMWEPADLRLHMASRIGRTAKPPGGDYPFIDRFDQSSIAAKLPDMAAQIALPKPKPAREESGPGLFEVMESRRSCRQFSKTGPDAAQIGNLFHHALGERKPGWRRYPNGGALYEQHFFLVIGRSADIEPGFYLYEAAAHQLGRIAASAENCTRMLEDAAGAMGVDAAPPMLVIIASEFAKVRWKYSGLSYALQLKHVGVIQHALYLAATATGLAGCALGTGNSESFARATGLDPLAIGSIGEFAVGVPDAQSAKRD